MCTLAPGSGVTSLLLTAGSCLSEDGEAVFAVSNSSGSVSIVRMPAIGAAGVWLVRFHLHGDNDVAVMPRCFFFGDNVGLSDFSLGKRSF